MYNKEFQNSFENATLKIIEGLAKNMELACLTVQRDAMKNCPYDTGVLRAAMFYQVKLIDGKLIKGTVGNTMEYAPYVHQGTGIYAIDGNGRKTPWNWGNRGSNKWPGRRGFSGGRANPFLENAKIANINKISELLAGV